jgi:O-antigen/teichoic acid export membrane protein
MAEGSDTEVAKLQREDRTAPSSAVAIRGGAIRVIGYAAGVLVSLGAATILLRHLGVRQFGRYVTVTSLIALVGGVTEAGIVVYGIREFVARDERDRRRLLANLLAMRLALTLLGVACAVVFGLAVGYGEVIVVGTLVAGAGLLVQVVSDVLSISLQAQLLLGRLTIAELSRRVLAMCLIAALAVLGAGLLPLLAASTIAGLFALGLIAWLSRAFASVRLRFDLRIWRGLFDETLPYAIALSITGIYVYVTVIIMSLIASETQTGLFATSFRVTQVLLAVPSLLLTAVFPLLSRESAETLRDSFGRVLAVALIGGVGMSLALALGADFIVHVLAASKARGAGAVLRIHSLMLIATFASTSSALVLVALRRYRPLIVTSVSVLLVDIVLALALVPPLGARGGALSDVIAESLAAIGLAVVVVRANPGIRVAASLFPPLLLASAAGSAMFLVPIGGLGRALGGIVIYFSALAAMRAIPEQVIGALAHLRVRLPLGRN